MWNVFAKLTYTPLLQNAWLRLLIFQNIKFQTAVPEINVQIYKTIHRYNRSLHLNIY